MVTCYSSKSRTSLDFFEVEGGGGGGGGFETVREQAGDTRASQGSSWSSKD